MVQNIWGFPSINSSTFDQTLGYKTYVSLINQNGGDPPTGVVLQNTLGVNITWSYVNPGVYFGVLDQNVFTSPDEYVTISGSWSDGAGIVANMIQVQVLFVNIIIVTSNSDGVPTDGIIGQTGMFFPPTILEIRKYA